MLSSHIHFSILLHALFEYEFLIYSFQDNRFAVWVIASTLDKPSFNSVI